MNPFTPTLEQLNQAPFEQAMQWLEGLYEHSPWIAQQALLERPFKTLAHLQYVMAKILENQGRQAKLDLICAHPELAGKAMQTNVLTKESKNEQKITGLTNCTEQELLRITHLNQAYRKKFGHPFILAVRGPRGIGLSKHKIMAIFERRLQNSADFELQECVRNIHRIVELRIQDKFATIPDIGNQVWDWHEELAQFSDEASNENASDKVCKKRNLTVTYLTKAHRLCAQYILSLMHQVGFDEVFIDDVGNVVGRYHGQDKNKKYLLTGSHYDTVHNAGKYDGRLGIFIPIVCIKTLKNTKQRLPFGVEVVAFSEEEGQRYNTAFLGSSALVGCFDSQWLKQLDADGIPMQEAMETASFNIKNITAIRRDPSHYLGFLEVHIEQGPVLNLANAPLGIVTAINASVRYLCCVKGLASHAGTTPMHQRYDALLAVSELSIFSEKRAKNDKESVATIGMLSIPNGSINVVPGRCEFSLDLRSSSNERRDALEKDILQEFKEICERRNLQYEIEKVMQAQAALCDEDLRSLWERSVVAQGLPSIRLPSGAGHDAMMLHTIMPQAMLFVRGENAGISHNPLESTTSSDMQLAAQAMLYVWKELADKS